LRQLVHDLDSYYLSSDDFDFELDYGADGDDHNYFGIKHAPNDHFGRS
jgi:hypothetical protein